MKNRLVFILLILTLIIIHPASAQQVSKTGLSVRNKISLDVKGMEVVDVIKMLATRSGMNIIVGKNVTGRVTLFLKEVDIWDAFEIVILANDLAYEKQGEIINVMTQRDYEALYGKRYQDNKQVQVIKLQYAKAVDISRALGQMKSDSGRVVLDESSNTIAFIDSPERIKAMELFVKETDLPLETRVFSLNYAPVDKLGSKIQEAITKGMGSIKIDERTNKIAVTDYPAKLSEIAKLISAFDEKTAQVLIDSQIIELTPSDKFEMGINLDYWIKKYFEVQASLPINTTNTLLIGTTSASPTQKGQYKAIIDILRTIGDTKILSSPRIMTLNNQEAKILVGTKDAYITSTTSLGGSGTTVTSQSVNFVDTGIKLHVTPTINKDSFVTMKIRPEVSSAVMTNIKSEDKITQIPIVTTSEAETTIMVKDGVTIVIGGLRKDERNKTIKKIPLLGDIPGLGYFFRSTSDETSKTELVILLTPHIMSGEKAYADFSEIRPKDGAIVRMIKGDIVTERIRERAEKKTPGNSEYKYYRLLTEKVKALTLFDSAGGEKGSVNVSFILNSNGEVKDEPVILSSTNPVLGKIVTEAIKRASSFPPFPKEMDKAEEIFRVTLDYK
ncbi:MAG: TonB family protein [bacterium]|nr:TonB family protein [bacterium]